MKKSIENIKNEINNIFNNKINNLYNNMDINFNFQSFFNYYKFKELTNEGIKRNFNKKIKKYNLLYKASRDGFSSYDFHRRCDGVSNTITLILTKDYKLFGGFTDRTWDKSNQFKGGYNGFIFSINNNKIYYKRSFYDKNIYCSEEDGPIFGNYDIYIKNNCDQNFGSYDWTNNNERAYNTPGNEHYLNGDTYFYVLDYAVYQIEFE